MRWKRLNPTETAGYGGPGRRWGHTCNAIRGGRLLYLFGGYGRDSCQTNQVHVFDTVALSWSQPAVRGRLPTPRDSHTCTTIGDNLLVFGGTDGVNPLNDLHILDTSSHTWVTPSVRGEGPEAREGHTAALVGKRLFVFGGCGKSKYSTEEVYYNDLFILDTETFVWQRAATLGTPPAARDSHTCSSWRNRIIVIGGEDGHNDYLSDVHVLDTDTLTWNELDTSGHKLSARAGHSAVPFDKYLMVFGGFNNDQNLYDDLYMLDIDTGNWTKIIATGDGPSARFSMAGDCLDPAISGCLVFFGGCNKSLDALDDMYYLYTDLVREFGRDERRLEKLSLRKQLKMKCQERYLPASSNDKALVSVGSPGVREPMASNQHGPQYFHLNDYQPTIGKRTFHAKVTNNVGTGYTIETVIDGKPLRGILFSDKPIATISPAKKSNGETDSAKVGEVKVNGSQEPKTNASTPKDHRLETATAVTMGHEALNSDKAEEVVAGTPLPVKDLDVNRIDHKADEAVDPNQDSEKNSAFQGGSSLPTGQGMNLYKHRLQNSKSPITPSDGQFDEQEGVTLSDGAAAAAERT